MYDIVFVDIPFIGTRYGNELAQEIEHYIYESEKIVNQITKREFQTKKYHYSSGILCLSSYLKSFIKNINIGYIHYEINMTDFQKYIKNTNIVAFSTMTYSMPKILELAETAKTINPEVRVVLGGYHASYFPEQLLKQYDFIDCIFIKEGENALLQYISNIPLDRICGIAYRNEIGTVCVNKECVPLSADEIPLPDYSLIKDNIHLFNISLTTMRGCIGKCKFCVNSNYWSLPRLIAIDKIITELTLLKDMLEQGTVIHINDNVFSISLSRINELYVAMKENGLLNYFVFECDTLSSTISVQGVRLLRKIGVQKICLGFEDSSDVVLKKSNKPVSFAQNVAASRIIKAEAPDICVYAYWLIGLPGSTPETLEHNLDKMQELIKAKVVDIISPKVFIPYPGTEFFNHYSHHKIKRISYDWEKYERRNPPYPYEYDCLSEDIIFDYLVRALRNCNKAYNCI